MARLAILWVLGLLTAVPYAAYHLLFVAPREQYALLIGFILFWIFGFWGLVTPLVTAVKIRRFFRFIENAPSKEELRKLLHSREAEDTAIEMIAADNRIPKFVARRLLRIVLKRLAERPPGRGPSPGN